MKAAVALLVVVAALALAAKVQASSFYFTAEDLESDEALWELYGRWAAHHGVVREPGRFPAFKANAHILHGKQRYAGELMALNVFGDQTFDEFMATTSCLKPEYFRLKEFNATLLKLAVSLQPISVSIGVNDDIRFWDPTVRGNVYYGPFNTDNVTHGVLIVGYDVDDLGAPYWIVKNQAVLRIC